MDRPDWKDMSICCGSVGWLPPKFIGIMGAVEMDGLTGGNPKLEAALLLSLLPPNENGFTEGNAVGAVLKMVPPVDEKIFVLELKEEKGLLEGGADGVGIALTGELLFFVDPKLKTFPLEGALSPNEAAAVVVPVVVPVVVDDATEEPKLNTFPLDKGLGAISPEAAGVLSLFTPKLKLLNVSPPDKGSADGFPKLIEEVVAVFLASSSTFDSVAEEPNEKPKAGLNVDASGFRSFFTSEPKLKVANGLAGLGGGMIPVPEAPSPMFDSFFSDSLFIPVLNPLKAGTLVLDVSGLLPNVNEGAFSSSILPKLNISLESLASLNSPDSIGSTDGSFAFASSGFFAMKLKPPAPAPKFKLGTAAGLLAAATAAAAFRLSILLLAACLSISSSFFCSSNCFWRRASLVERSRVSRSSSATRAFSFSVSRRSTSSFLLDSFIY